jgi:hypothetical protein
MCSAAGITMTRVEPDGRYWLRGENTTSFAAFHDCMAEQQRKHPYQEWLADNQRQPRRARRPHRQRSTGQRRLAA